MSWQPTFDIWRYLYSPLKQISSELNEGNGLNEENKFNDACDIRHIDSLIVSK